MTLRAKLVAALGLLSAIATLSLGAWTYGATERNLRAEIDRSLDEASDVLIGRGERRSPVDLLEGVPRRGPRLPPVGEGPGEGDEFVSDDGRGFAQVLVQVVDAGGRVVISPSIGQLPTAIDNVTRRTTNGYLHEFGDIRIGDEPFRMLNAPAGGGLTIQVARSLDETERVLGSLRSRTLLAVGLVSLAAGAVGWLVARQITRRLTHLTLAAEDVARTGSLDVDVPVTGRDEAGRLGHAFADMLGALARSRDDQQRLVQDAGHELRTPLTSLRTNIATLQRHDHIAPDVRRNLMDDLDSEARELTTLVNELVELATDKRADEPLDTVRLADIVDRVVERSGRRTSRRLVVTADDSTVTGQPAALERAIGNLVDNALKFDADGTAPVEIVVERGRVTVGDRGPGITEADLPLIFDRFHRAVSSRSRPGSGLGLAIVQDVTRRHGGTVFAGNRPGGGASIGFQLPLAFQTNSHPDRERFSNGSTMITGTAPIPTAATNGEPET